MLEPLLPGSYVFLDTFLLDFVLPYEIVVNNVNSMVRHSHGERKATDGMLPLLQVSDKTCFCDHYDNYDYCHNIYLNQRHYHKDLEL